MSTLWLLCVLCLPRLTLGCSYLFDYVPANDTNFWIDAVGTLLAPRLLVAYWGQSGGEMGKLWLMLMVIVGLCEIPVAIRWLFGK